MSELQEQLLSGQGKKLRASGEPLFSPKEFVDAEICRSCSIVLQNNQNRLESVQQKTENALSNSYEALRGTSSEVMRTSYEAHTLTKSLKRLSMSTGLKDSLGLNRRLFLDQTMKPKKNEHLQSADLFDNFSPVQKQRRLWEPTLPDVYSMGQVKLVDAEAPELTQRDAEELKTLHPRTFGQPCVLVQPNVLEAEQNPLLGVNSSRYGILLSGGPAPGGHNVIAGFYDYVKQLHPANTVYGFLGGLDGLFKNKYCEITDELMDRFRNQGGFDMLWSGRGRINGVEDLFSAVHVCREHQLEGIVIVGGDGSLSNAALFAEFFAEHLPECTVIGVPKTIDGDLRNAWIEVSFGFDTAAKTYSELIGNLCTDVTTGQQIYHFVRVMGRSASHIVVECALQTRPNYVLIGEEIEKNNTSLVEIINQLVDLILDRQAMNKSFGIVLVPEGLIEFIPEIKQLIANLNLIMKTEQNNKTLNSSEVEAKLSDFSRQVWKFLPKSIREQLLSDRESTGYIQVGRIATERLLKLLTESELRKRKIEFNDLIIMTHYFGYEGRCAMPSNFDANYCYGLGYTAGVLTVFKKTGYVAVVRRLEQHPTVWAPGGIPLTRMMEVKSNEQKKRFPAIIRQLFDLNSPLYQVLQSVRQKWRVADCYRSPGPIQFEGPVADAVTHTVYIPRKEDLLCESDTEAVALNKAVCPKVLKLMSTLQRLRLQDKPEVPDICRDIYARAIPGAQHFSKNPFTQRQILLYYPYICNNNKFQLCEVVKDLQTSPVGSGLKVGVVFLSRQAPGVMNVLWGIIERLKIIRGRCFGFYGTNGLCHSHYTEITEKDIAAYVNQGGMEFLGRSATMQRLLTVQSQELACKTCMSLQLDGLIMVGSSLAITEATLTAEYFLANQCPTCVIAVPATGSNNLSHELIETSIGFDTSSKVYASLIGNVLADGASMPKYWHFVRLMGRHPSYEVLECALQTHPNVVIISEEYGAGNKTLGDVVNDIADVVCRRSALGKNFGSVLIPDALLTHLPNMKALISELENVMREAQQSGCLQDLLAELHSLCEEDTTSLISKLEMSSSNTPKDSAKSSVSSWIHRITPWSLALFRSLPEFIRKELTQTNMGEMRFNLLETELLLSQMVQKELLRRKSEGKFSGKFSAVCHFFGYQGRSSLPSLFDAKLGFVYGHLATICVESGLTAYCCTIRGLCGDVKDWKLAAIPFNSMLMLTAQSDAIHLELRHRQNELPIIPIAEVDLNGKAFRWMKTALISQWQLQDRFCNPGPVQFFGLASTFYHRILHEEQAEYFRMLQHVQLYSRILRDTCSFGIDEQFLKVVFSNLHSLLSMYYHSDDLISFLPQLTDFQQYEEAQKQAVMGRTPLGKEATLQKPLSLIGSLAALRLRSKASLSRLSSHDEKVIFKEELRQDTDWIT